MELPKRKKIRLKDFDYSQNNAFFITICTHNRKTLFDTVGADSISARLIDDIFRKIIEQYPNVYCPKYVVMPNHFHAIIVMNRADMESAPTLSEVVQAFKRYSTIEYIKLVKMGVLPAFKKQIWQRSFYDHVIRNEQDYLDIWKYIDENPLIWREDELYDA
jgi:REP element-mobilizing transposase RayT